MRSLDRLVVTWAAVIAVLTMSVAPAISHVIGLQNPIGWSAICTSAGARQAATGDAGDDKQTPPNAAHVLEHCPYCNLHSDGFAPPPVLAALPGGILLGELVPPAFLHAANTLSVWS